MLGDHVALVVQHLLHQIGGVQIAAVDGGRLGPDQLQGGDGEGLAEGVGGQGGGVGQQPLLIGDARGLAHQVDAGLLQQAEGLHVLVVLLAAHPAADVDEGRVAGVAHRLLQDLQAVA